MLTRVSRRDLGRYAGALAVAPWLASCGGGASDDSGALPPENPREKAYERAVESVLATYRPPGVLAGVRIAGEAAWTRAFGQADIATATPMSLNSTFPIRSITKSFTVTLLLQLVKLGRVALDDKIGQYIVGVPNGDLINLADLAGNQTGLADYSQQPGFFEIFVQDTMHVWTPQELLAFAFENPPAFLPGAQYEYSNTNTVLLGQLVEVVTGQSLSDVMVEQIFKPLGLNGTRYAALPYLPAPAPVGYSVDIVTGVVYDQPLVSPTSLAGSGAIASTLTDLLVWGDALGKGALLNPALQDLRKSRARKVTNGPEYDRYGLGIGQIGNWWGHTGTGVGFQVATMNLASRSATISVMLNASPDGGRRHLNLAQELFEKLAAVVETT